MLRNQDRVVSPDRVSFELLGLVAIFVDASIHQYTLKLIVWSLFRSFPNVLGHSYKIE